MRYLKFVCRSSTCRGRNSGRPLAWFRLNRLGARKPSDVASVECPRCKATLRCSRVQKSKPKGGIWLDGALTRRKITGRVRRRAMTQATERIDRMARKPKRRKTDSLADDDPLGLNVQSDDDPEYAPPPLFNPYMRLTSGSTRRSVRSLVLRFPGRSKSFGKKRITTSHSRSRSSTNQNAVMGAKILGVGKSLAAWRHAGRTAYTTNRFKSAEWCHLVADCLGGPTAPNNLVAASYAANTEMMAIENLLMGKTHLQVHVEAQCEKLHVAELIFYTVYCNKGHHWRHTIDAKNDYFTRDDLEDLRDSLKDFLSTHKRC